VLADDFGSGEALLSAFRITRMAPSAQGTLRLRGNSELLVARPVAQHPLAVGVTALVTNHPQAVVHSDLDPIFGFGGEQALVLAGAVEEGRLVALSDPSVLINNMMRFGGNRTFAGNLFRYLREDRDGRIVLVVGEARIVGRYGTPGADRPLHDLRASIESLAAIDVPPEALTVGTLALLAIFGLLAFGSLPRRSPYAEQAMFAQKAAHGGFLGRVRYFTRDAKNLLSPLMVYKFELEAVLIERLGLTGRTPLKEVMAELRERGVPKGDVEDLRALLIELNDLWDRQDIPPDPPMVRRRRFLRLVATGERVLNSAEEVRKG
jgi:predicted HTH domain antitoxin